MATLLSGCDRAFVRASIMGSADHKKPAQKALRVKSVNPPPKSSAGWSDFGIFGAVLLSAALFLQTPWAGQAWEAVLRLPFIQGDAKLASLILLWSPNLVVYYPYSAFYAAIDLVWYDAFKHKKVQPVSFGVVVKFRLAWRC